MSDRGPRPRRLVWVALRVIMVTALLRAISESMAAAMRGDQMMRLGRRAVTALCLATTIVWASAASARIERFRWNQATTPAVDNFKLYWGSASGSYSSSLSLGVPAKDSTGAYFYDLVVPDTATVYVTVTAWSGGLESVRSNEISRAGTSSGGGGTTSPPPTGTAPNAPVVTASGAIVHVAPSTSGAAATGGWIKLYAFTSTGGPLTFADPVSGGGFPRDLDLTPYFTQLLSASRIEAEGCAQNTYGFTCAARLSVPRTSLAAPSTPLGAPGQPFIVP